MSIESEKEANIEHNSNETILNVKDLSEHDGKYQICDEKEMIARNVSKMQTPDKMKTIKRDVEMLNTNRDHKRMSNKETADAQITEKCVLKNQILETNDFKELVPRNLFLTDRESHALMAQPNKIVEQ